VVCLKVVGRKVIPNSSAENKVGN